MARDDHATIEADLAAQAGDVKAALAAGMMLAEPVHADSHELIVRLRDRSGQERIERVALTTERPAAKAGTVTLHSVQSLNLYVQRHRTADTVIYADQEGERITAVLDDHGKAPGHCRHRAVYPCPVTTEWAAWRKVLGRALSQEALVDFLEERALDIVEPPAAELQEMIRELTVKADVVWKKAFDERTGTVRLEYKEDVSDTAGRTGQVALPAHFTAGIAIYKGGEPYRCQVRLRYRLADAKLRLQLSIDNVERIEEVAFADAVKELEAGLGGETLVLHGVAP